MPRLYPDKLRTLAVEKVMAGESRRSVARQLDVTASAVIKWVQRYSETGSVSPSRMGGYCKPKLEGHRAWVLERIKVSPSITLAGLRDQFGKRGVAASIVAVRRFLKSCNITWKILTSVADERDRPDAERRREQ